MPRVSAKQQLLRDVFTTILRCIKLRFRHLRRLRTDDETSSSGFDFPNDFCSELGRSALSDATPHAAAFSSAGSSFPSSSSSEIGTEAETDSSSANWDAPVESVRTDAQRAATLINRLSARRVLNETRLPRNIPPLHQRLLQLQESGLPTDLQTFRHLVRMHPEAFDSMVRIISSHPVFAAKDPRRAQAPIAEQLAVTLYWLGRSGNGGGIQDVASACGCAEGSVIAYVTRCTEALYDIRPQLLCWANEEEKEEARAWVARQSKCVEFSRGWSMVDGSQIPLAFKPGKDAHHREYFDRKGQYALNLQLTVLPTTLRIIDFVAGYKGSTQDSRAFAASDVVKQPDKYLDEGDFVWTDGGYGLSHFTCSPYDHVAAAKSRDFRGFNGAVSNIRVRSEHAFGFLKGRFQCLRGLRVFIQNEDGHHRAVKIVVAAMVAHNFALRWDTKEDVEHFIDLSSVSEEARDAWFDLQRPDAQREEEEARAWARRVQRQRERDRTEMERMRTLSQWRLDLERREKGKKLREELHTSLFAAQNKAFTNTTPESRLCGMTTAEHNAMLERQRLRAAAAAARARGQRRGGAGGAGAGRGRGGDHGRGGSAASTGGQGRGERGGRGRGRGRGGHGERGRGRGGRGRGGGARGGRGGLQA